MVMIMKLIIIIIILFELQFLPKSNCSHKGLRTNTIHVINYTLQGVIIITSLI